MEIADRKVIESILLLADEPIPATTFGEVLERPRAEILEALAQLRDAYEAEDRGFVLREVAGGWRLYTHPDCAPWLERFVLRHRHARLTGAALEVLAIIAYKQPISRSLVAEIRGVDSDGVVKTFLQRGLIREAGHDRGPGSPVLFCLSEECLERLGLSTIEDLPPLASFMPDPEAIEDMEAKLSPDV